MKHRNPGGEAGRYSGTERDITGLCLPGILRNGFGGRIPVRAISFKLGM
jgi:hypothetical protein